MDIVDDKEGLRYWVRLQVPVCGLIMALPAVVAVKFIKRKKVEPLNHSDLWTPCWRNLNPLWLLVYRAFAFVCLAWTFALVMVYFVLGTLVSAYGCLLSSKQPPPGNVNGSVKLTNMVQEEIQQKARVLGSLMQTIYQTCAGAVMLTDLVFWCILVPFLLGDQFNLTLAYVQAFTDATLYLRNIPEETLLFFFTMRL